MQTFKIKEEYIHLNQLLKALSWSANGAEANAAIDNGEVKVNGEIETRKRNKLRPGDRVQFKNEKAEVE